MSIPEIQQATSILKKATSILLLVPQKPTTDAFASMMALSLALHKETMQCDAVSPSHVPHHLQFLPGSSQVVMRPKLQASVVIDIAGISAASAIRQEPLNGGMRIHVQLKEGAQVSADLIETHVQQLPYDCIVVFGSSDITEVGTLFTEHADFFYNTPVINIDHKANNEHFGTVNIVDITASSIAEITHELLTAISPNTLDEDVATCLYAGIVAATESFQKPSTTPYAFQLAAELMKQKANTDAVIQQLVKTKPLPLLKLAGRTYARLRHDEHGQLFWSVLRELDFAESGATRDHIPGVMHELTNNISGYNVAFLLFEDSLKKYTVYITVGKGLGKRKHAIQEKLGARKEQGLLVFSLDAPSLEEAEKRAITHAQSIVPSYS